MTDLARGVNTSSMRSFHLTTSTPFIEQNETAWLDQAFGDFFEQGDFSTLLRSQPRFHHPASLQDNILTVKGHYPSPAWLTKFSLKYVYEGLGWKILGIHIELEKP